MQHIRIYCMLTCNIHFFLKHTHSADLQSSRHPHAKSPRFPQVFLVPLMWFWRCAPPDGLHISSSSFIYIRPNHSPGLLAFYFPSVVWGKCLQMSEGKLQDRFGPYSRRRRRSVLPPALFRSFSSPPSGDGSNRKSCTGAQSTSVKPDLLQNDVSKTIKTVFVFVVDQSRMVRRRNIQIQCTESELVGNWTEKKKLSLLTFSGEFLSSQCMFGVLKEVKNWKSGRG